MSIRVALHHHTRYHYDRPIQIMPQVVRLRPAPHCRTPIVGYSLKVTPEKHFINWQQDPHGNFLARLVFPEKSDVFSIEVDLLAELTVVNPFDFFLEPSAEKIPFKYDANSSEDLRPYLVTVPLGQKMAQFLGTISREEMRTVDYLVYLNSLVNKRVEYVVRMDPGVQTPEETLTLGKGSCRDSAWLLVQVLRELGLAARFCSGYLIQLTADVKSLDGPSGTEVDFTDLHAWTEVFLPGAGWIGLDPTSGLFAGEGHIPLAATPDPSSAAPVTGSVEPCETTFDFAMTVTRIHEDPRVTKPYTEEQWATIEKLGHQVDAEIAANDMRLTMGGEPTFVSIDDVEGDEWNTAAMGPLKRKLSGQLIRRLADKFSIGPLMHYGQGKWYPGEPLPRWSLSCYWRKDGQKIWNDLSLIAEDEAGLKHTEADAQAFVTELAGRLGVDADNAEAAYEDAWYYMWKERKLPSNVDPLKSNLADKVERDRLAKVFTQGLNKVVGYALPLARNAFGTAPGWRSGSWFLRDEHMYLLPGDSPMGYRLPLDSFPWVAPKDFPHVLPSDPFADRGPLPGRLDLPGSENWLKAYKSAGQNGTTNGYGGHAPFPQSREFLAPGMTNYASTVIRRQMNGDGGLGEHGAGAGNVALETPRLAESRTLPWPQNATIPENVVLLEQGKSAQSIVRTALCVEPRNGKLHIFMPPLEHVEDYLDLVAKLEQTAEHLKLPIVIEGYLPPHDHRLTYLRVTPDPGVIEVNLQPAASWDELVRNTTVLYDEARQTRLGTEKFMLDGRHTGTGGGNHIVLGGPTAADSPILRRPDLLRSLVGYWNNHPSLSYLFSGLFVGPTSQAPRMDEARHEAVYELETAFQQLPDAPNCPPWMTDRLFRHLLIDVTGNTHRAEFCIDKLFSPDSSTGRLGLVELRAFEMPPHARMSLTQQLLLRGLLAEFWKRPYQSPLVRWGTGLHDRFMLPHFIAEDFVDVIDDLKSAGFDFQQDWFDAHFEFRFPFCGKIVQRGVEVEIRQAIEPWHVLGEESSASGTSRFVDSSVERVQVKVSGLIDPRHAITCNGRRVPLHPTGKLGEYVAGVRYRAWQPPSCLHPTIGVHAPLTFDVVDTWSQRSIGGCMWHVAHPGGLSYTTFPINAYEAETRRTSRFFAMGHTPGKITVPPDERNKDYPMTLDLRRDPVREFPV
ncbi:MAG: transglutaminase family protein [Planctomycetia bacterium]|nr:transglutaminase family protein [Planctomycetia bacterium]